MAQGGSSLAFCPFRTFGPTSTYDLLPPWPRHEIRDLMILLYMSLLLSHQAVPRVDYVPDTGWRDNEWGQTFYERWFGNQLKAMQEPALSNNGDLGSLRERMRLLVLPTFEPAYSYRVDVRQNGSASLRWARLTGRGGYAPGTLARQGSRELRHGEISSFRSALAAAALATLPREENDGISDNPDGSQTLTICLDGTTYVFEYLDASSRHYVVRSCDIDEQPLDRLAETLLRFRPRNRMD